MKGLVAQQCSLRSVDDSRRASSSQEYSGYWLNKLVYPELTLNLSLLSFGFFRRYRRRYNGEKGFSILFSHQRARLDSRLISYISTITRNGSINGSNEIGSSFICRGPSHGWWCSNIGGAFGYCKARSQRICAGGQWW